MARTSSPLLEIRNLSVEFQTHRGPFRAVDGIDLTLDSGELLGVVGESGLGRGAGHDYDRTVQRGEKRCRASW